MKVERLVKDLQPGDRIDEHGHRCIVSIKCTIFFGCHGWQKIDFDDGTYRFAPDRERVIVYDSLGGEVHQGAVMHRELAARFEVGHLYVTIWGEGGRTLITVQDSRMTDPDEIWLDGPPPTKPVELADMILCVVRG